MVDGVFFLFDYEALSDRWHLVMEISWLLRWSRVFWRQCFDDDSQICHRTKDWQAVADNADELRTRRRIKTAVRTRGRWVRRQWKQLTFFCLYLMASLRRLRLVFSTSFSNNAGGFSLSWFKMTSSSLDVRVSASKALAYSWHCCDSFS